jgi:ABC-2 type transport system ATP-binding protein
MKQRLGVAMALLHRPELLVLDEPGNGLDPAGIQDLRLLLKRLAADHQLTVFLSSHILAELEQTATKVAVITRGRLRYQGTIEALKASQGGRLRVTVDRADHARALLERDGLAVSTAGHDALTVDTQDRERCAAVTAALVAGGIKVYQVALEQPNLEDAFLDIVRRHEGSAAA